jgi:hypothetical protein
MELIKKANSQKSSVYEPPSTEDNSFTDHVGQRYLSDNEFEEELDDG